MLKLEPVLPLSVTALLLPRGRRGAGKSSAAVLLLLPSLLTASPSVPVLLLAEGFLGLIRQLSPLPSLSACAGPLPFCDGPCTCSSSVERPALCSALCASGRSLVLLLLAAYISGS